MPIRRFSDSLPMLLLRAREGALARLRPVLHAHGLTEQQWRVLRALQDLGELSAAGLANECSILAPSMTRIVRKLAGHGLLVTQRSARDQRELKVTLSSAGRELVAELEPQIEREYEKLCRRLRPEQLARLQRDLGDLIETAGVPGEE